jgi:hypothetical protein
MHVENRQDVLFFVILLYLSGSESCMRWILSLLFDVVVRNGQKTSNLNIFSREYHIDGSHNSVSLSEKPLICL